MKISRFMKMYDEYLVCRECSRIGKELPVIHVRPDQMKFHLKKRNERKPDIKPLSPEEEISFDHEFRTSLNAIMGFAQILKLLEDSCVEIKSFAEIIYNESENLLSIYKKIMNRLSDPRMNRSSDNDSPLLR
jgi:hypothetical protein